MNIKAITATPSVREQAEAEVRQEQAAKAKEKMKAKLRDLAAAQAVVKGIEIQIADLERQIEDGTL
ncbi:hypothetical protein [Rhodoferax fermentans]|uniref:Uncharacterized protein n=1 Tax=Rhodoferax fermentans TaxID=28066 RepID=A0A1T1ANT0_RHOFE|nr:hypothetical protein [Rhodoferax fermentans]MBK1683466.1 hypothetical protein [Rhodoferax fermentans]OOV05791.1 hypothetical protein RF819_02870 [Rhodoferax fermentans]